MKKSTLLIIGLLIIILAVGIGPAINYFNGGGTLESEDGKPEVETSLTYLNDLQDIFAFSSDPTWSKAEYKKLKSEIDAKHDAGDIRRSTKADQYRIMHREYILKMNKYAMDKIGRCSSLTDLYALKQEWDHTRAQEPSLSSVASGTYNQVSEVLWFLNRKNAIRSTSFSLTTFNSLHSTLNSKYSSSSVSSCSEITKAKDDAIQALDDVHFNYLEKETNRLIRDLDSTKWNRIRILFRTMTNDYSNASYVSTPSSSLRTLTSKMSEAIEPYY